ncbi:hypothetical protein JCM37172_02830 [Faecalimonas hominis]
MDYKLPYYMAYPMPFEYDDERKERQDMEYMKSLYPNAVKRILPFVEDECERMEYEGSMIYDEYPDMLGIRLMCNRICERVEAMDRRDDIEDELEMQQNRWNNRRDIRDIVEVLLLNELMKRRNEHRRRRRRFY